MHEQMNSEIDSYRERFTLALRRIREIPSEKRVKEPFRDWFEKEAAFLSEMAERMMENEKGNFQEASLEELREQNHHLYEDILPENYGRSFGNPD